MVREAADEARGPRFDPSKIKMLCSLLGHKKVGKMDPDEASLLDLVFPRRYKDNAIYGRT